MTATPFAAALALLALGIPGASAPIPQDAAKPAAPAETVFVIRAKRVLPVAGPAMEDAVVVVKNGRITAIGRGVDVPGGATELQAEVVTPGLVESNLAAGIRGMGVENAFEVTPDFRAVDNLDPAATDFERLVRGGVTSAFAAPRDWNVVGGLAGIVKTAPAGRPRVVNGAAALKLAVGEEPSSGNFTPRGFGVPQSFRVRRPGSRPATVMEMRLAFFAVERARREGKALAPAQQPLADALDGKLPVRVHARNLVDLRAALRVAGEFGFTVTVDDALEAHRYLPQLVAAKAKVVLGPMPRDLRGGVDGNGRRIDFTDERPVLDRLAVVSAAGLPVALSASGAPVEDDLATQMRLAVRHGASRDVALRAVTAGAAEILGIGDRVGTLEVGRDADLVLWDGDPFELTSSPATVLVDGRISYQRAAR